MIIDIDKTHDGRIIFIPFIQHKGYPYDMINLLDQAGLNKNWKVVDMISIVFYKE